MRGISWLGDVYGAFMVSATVPVAGSSSPNDSCTLGPAVVVVGARATSNCKVRRLEGQGEILRAMSITVVLFWHVCACECVWVSAAVNDFLIEPIQLSGFQRRYFLILSTERERELGRGRERRSREQEDSERALSLCRSLSSGLCNAGAAQLHISPNFDDSLPLLALLPGSSRIACFSALAVAAAPFVVVSLHAFLCTFLLSKPAPSLLSRCYCCCLTRWGDAVL